MKIGAKKTSDVSAGTMTRRVDLLVASRVSDGEGGFTTTFDLQEVVWGDFRPSKSYRKDLEGNLTFYQDAKVYIRYGVTITEDYKLTIEGHTYTIQSINDVDNQHRYLEINLYADVVNG